MLQQLPPIARYEAEPAVLPPVDEMEKKQVQIRREGDVFFVEADWLLKVMQMIDFDDYESLQYFQRVLISSGVIQALRDAGCEEGNTVSMYELEFDFVD